jgi:hypothetical protein
MAAVAKKSDIAIALDRAISEIDATARDNHHLPHAWNIDGNAANCFCRACGQSAAVRVDPVTLNVWKAGHLRFTTCKRP